MKQLPPIFKINNVKPKDTNQRYYHQKVSNKITLNERGNTVEKNIDMLTIEEKINKIFKTKGYAFNIPVTIEFAGKKIDTYLALRKNNSIITLDNEVIPISTITSLEIKSPSD